MLVRCWGSRGSVSVSGKEFIKYGGDTTCLEIVTDNDGRVIVDAGTGIRKLGSRLVSENSCNINIVLTHPHWDHLLGFPFFKPLYKESCKINVWGPQPTQESVRSMISKTMSPPYFPIELKDIHADINFFSIEGKGFSIGSLNITTIPLNHPNHGAGYRFEENGKSFVFLTDNELTHTHSDGVAYEDYVKFAGGADLLFHDAEYTPEDYTRTKGWGHSVYLDTIRFAMDAGVKALGLFHHNQDRDDKGIDAIVADCRKILKEKGSGMDCFAVADGSEVKL
jgi:phosphoribosyl 1,2-cyclic phosphodiesterase